MRILCRKSISVIILGFSFISLVSCTASNPNQGNTGFRELNDPFLNDFALMGYNWNQQGLELMNSLCSSDSLVGYERGFELAFGLKRDQLNSLELETNGQEYRRLAQELEGYAVQWEILNQDLRSACRTRAFCMLADMNSNSGDESRTSTRTTDNTVTSVTVDNHAVVSPRACENAEADYDRRVQAARDFVIRITEINVLGQ